MFLLHSHSQGPRTNNPEEDLPPQDEEHMEADDNPIYNDEDDDICEVGMHHSDYDDLDEFNRQRRADNPARESRSPSRFRAEEHEREGGELLMTTWLRNPPPAQPPTCSKPIMHHGQRHGVLMGLCPQSCS